MHNPHDSNIVAQCNVEVPDGATSDLDDWATQPPKILRINGQTTMAIPISLHSQQRTESASIVQNVLKDRFTEILERDHPELVQFRTTSTFSELEPTTWQEAQQWFRLLKQKNISWVKKSTDAEDSAGIPMSSAAVEDIVKRGAAAQRIPSYHADFLGDLEEDVGSASLQYLLFSFKDGQFKHVGFWAPDVLDELRVASYEEICVPPEARRTPLQLVEVKFMAITRTTDVVNALGVLPYGDTGTYYRIGVGMFDATKWDSLALDSEEILII